MVELTRLWFGVRAGRRSPYRHGPKLGAINRNQVVARVLYRRSCLHTALKQTDLIIGVTHLITSLRRNWPAVTSSNTRNLGNCTASAKILFAFFLSGGLLV